MEKFVASASHRLEQYPFIFYDLSKYNTLLVYPCYPLAPYDADIHTSLYIFIHVFPFSLLFENLVAPNITTPRNSFGVYEASDATLECIVEAYPMSTNHWMKGSTLLLVTNSSGSSNGGSNSGSGDVAKIGYNGVHNNEDEVISRR